MISDERRPPFCYQTHAALDAIRSKFTGAKRTTAIAVYVVMTETANRQGGATARASGFRAARAEIAERVGISVDTLDRYVSDLCAIPLLNVIRERAGEVNLPNRWSLVEPPRRTDAPPSRMGAATPSRTDAAQEPRSDVGSKGEKESDSAARAAVPLLRQAWAAGVPTLIAHRDAYFATPEVTTAVKKALRVYTPEEVAEAIGLYAEILGSSAYRWSHSWTFIDFLGRGLDRFVASARPRDNFRATRHTDGSPRRAPDVDEL